MARDFSRSRSPSVVDLTSPRQRSPAFKPASTSTNQASRNTAATSTSSSRPSDTGTEGGAHGISKTAKKPRPRIIPPSENPEDSQEEAPRARKIAQTSAVKTKTSKKPVTPNILVADTPPNAKSAVATPSAPPGDSSDDSDSDTSSSDSSGRSPRSVDDMGLSGFGQNDEDDDDLYETPEQQTARLEADTTTASPPPPPPSRAQSPVAATRRPRPETAANDDSNHSDISIDAPFPPEAPGASDLYVDNKLLSYGVVINIKDRLIICTACHDAFLPDILANHLATQHKLPRMPEAYINRLTLEFGLYEDTLSLVEDLPDKVRAPIEGITIQRRGNHCRLCNEARGNINSMRQHYNTAHYARRSEYTKAPQGDFQELHMTSNFRRLIPVTEAIANLPEREFYSTWFHSVDHHAQPQFKPSSVARETPMWLQIVGWRDYIKDLNLEAIRPLVKPRKKDERFAWVQPAIVAYLRNVKKKLHEFTPQILGWLSSINGVYTTEFFKAPQQDETLVEYARPTSALICVALDNLIPPTIEFQLPLNESQIDRLRALHAAYMENDEDVKHPAVQAALHEAFVSLFLYKLDGSGTRFKDCLQCINVLLSLAAGGGFKRVRKLTQKYAAEAWTITAVCAMQMYIDKDKPGFTFFSACEKWRVYLFQGEPSPMGNLHAEWMTISGAARDETEPPRMLYLDNSCQHFTFDNARCSVEEVRQMVHAVYKDCEDLLCKLTFGFDLDSFGFNLREIEDKLSSDTVGYSWLSDDRNGFRSVPGLLFRKLATSPDPNHRNHFGTVDSNNNIIWNAVNCHRYMNMAQELLRALQDGTHLSHGQTSRATEMMSITIVNLPDVLRSFMLHNGQVVFTLTSSKTDSVSRRNRLIPHFQTEEMSRFLVIYVGVVREVEKVLAAVLYDREKADLYRTHLFVGPGGHWTSDMMSNELQRITSHHLGVNLTLGVRDLRQLLVAIYYRHCNSYVAFEDLKDDHARAHDQAGNLTGGHSEQIAREFYGVEFQTHGQIKETVWRALCQYCAGVAIFWGLTPGNEDTLMLPWPTKVEFAAPTNSIDISKLTPAIKNVVQDVVARSEARVEIRFREILRDELARAKASDVFGPVTPNASQGNTIAPASSSPPPPPGDATLLAYLQLFSRGKFTRFVSQTQAQAVALVQARSDNSLVVMRTGGGKSVLYMLPWLTFHGHLTSVLAIPLVSVALDTLRRCLDANIACSEWSPRNSTPEDALVIVSVEHLSRNDFQAWSSKLATQKRIAQLYLDEAHIAVSGKSYRPHLAFLRTLYHLGVPVMAMTATSPPSVEHALKEVLGVSRLLVLRELTQVPNISYRVYLHRNQQACLEACIRTVRHYDSWLSESDGRGIIICKSRAGSEELAAALTAQTPELASPLRAYHGNLTQDEKHEIYKSWVSGVQKVMPATTGFSTGIDFPRVRYVIALLGAYNMEDLVQMLGRAGRDGQLAYGIVHAVKGETKKPPEEDLLGVGDVQDFIFKETVCRRLPISRWTDGHGVTCLSMAELCDLCEKRLRNAPVAVTTASSVRTERAPVVSQPPPTEPLTFEEPSHQRAFSNTQRYSDESSVPPSQMNSKSYPPKPSAQKNNSKTPHRDRSFVPPRQVPPLPPRPNQQSPGPYAHVEDVYTPSSIPAKRTLSSVDTPTPDLRSSQRSWDQYFDGPGGPEDSTPYTSRPPPQLGMRRSTSSQAQTPFNASQTKYTSQSVPPLSHGDFKRPTASPPRPPRPATEPRLVAHHNQPQETPLLFRRAPPVPEPGYNVLLERERHNLAMEKARAADNELRAALDAMKPFCTICWVLRNKYTTGHLAGGCYAEFDASTYFAWNKTWRVEDVTRTCSSCLIPTLRIRTNHDRKDKGHCTYSDILTPVAWAAWVHEPTRARVLAHFRLEFDTVDGYNAWLFAKRTEDAYINAIELFLFLYRSSLDQ